MECKHTRSLWEMADVHYVDFNVAIVRQDGRCLDCHELVTRRCNLNDIKLEVQSEPDPFLLIKD